MVTRYTVDSTVDGAHFKNYFICRFHEVCHDQLYIIFLMWILSVDEI